MAQWTPEDATYELLHVLPFLNRMMIAELRPGAGEETTMPQFRVLAHLVEKPSTLSAIARLRRVSLQSAGELVQSLHLTEAGRQHYDKTSKRMQARLLPLMQRLTDAELAAVQVALPALHRILTEESIDVGDN